ncbi:MAG: hypothetical protein GY811_28130 [Myxococcales bacterium]|nr:hypothetical protein [Myxococcales bacterium]
MIPAKVFHFREPAAAIIGFQEFSKRGITPRSILFISLDTRGECHVAIPQASAEVGQIRVGDKMSCETPWEGRYYHFDAIHRLPGDTVLWNGDRRLDDTGSATEIAYGVSRWLKQQGTKNMFLGCTPHQPGSWWISDERSPVSDLHASGLVDAVVTTSGLLARRIGEPGLFYLDFASLRSHGIRDNWTKIYTSDLGNILMLERRVINYSLVLSCERGLVELDISGLPESITEKQRTTSESSGLGVVGRIDGGAFAVCRGDVEPWGLARITPAQLVGSSNQRLSELPAAMAHD